MIASLESALAETASSDQKKLIEARIAELEAAAKQPGKVTPAPTKSRNPRANQKLPEGIWPVAKRLGAPRDLVALAWKMRNGAFEDAAEAEAALAQLVNINRIHQ